MRLAVPKDMDEAMGLSMEAFFGRPSVYVGMSPLALFAPFENPRGNVDAPPLPMHTIHPDSRGITLPQHARHAVAASLTSHRAGESFRAYEFLMTGMEVRKRLSASLGEGGVPVNKVDCAVFVAAKGSELCGMVELIRLPYPSHPGPSTPYLFNLCVRPSFRKMGNFHQPRARPHHLPSYRAPNSAALVWAHPGILGTAHSPAACVPGLGRMLVERCELQAREWGDDRVFLHVEHDDVREVTPPKNNNTHRLTQSRCEVLHV